MENALSILIYGMDTIERIKEKLAKYKELKWEHEKNTITVSPEGGFVTCKKTSEGLKIVTPLNSD